MRTSVLPNEIVVVDFRTFPETDVWRLKHSTFFARRTSRLYSTFFKPAYRDGD